MTCVCGGEWETVRRVTRCQLCKKHKPTVSLDAPPSKRGLIVYDRAAYWLQLADEYERGVGLGCGPCNQHRWADTAAYCRAQVELEAR